MTPPPASDPTASAVTEPAGLTLLGIGLAGLAGYGLRKRKQAVTT